MKKKDCMDKCIWLIPAIVVCMLAVFFFCTKKEGYHEDEYYSFYSTARTAGLTVSDQAWKPVGEILREYTVQPGEGFRYGFVKEVQSWDVHPPVYYWLLHTVESLFPGCFSKWIGLSVNLAAFFAGLLLFARLAESILQDQRLLPFAVLAYGSMPAALSGVTFIRMYALLTVFVLWAAILHCRYLTRDRLPMVSFFLPLGVCTYLGFMTQYYYFVFLFFMAGGFCIYRLAACKRVKEVIGYGLTMIVVFGAAYFTYPAFPGQMFKGQRGAQATASFFDLSNTWMRIRFFAGLVNAYVFGGIFPLLCLAALIVLLVFLWRGIRRKEAAGRVFGTSLQENEKAGLLLAFSAAGYFLAVSKTGLLLGDSSIRYQMPVCGIILLLAIFAAGRKTRIGGIVCAVVLILFNLYGAYAGKVLFLYEEDAGQKAFAAQCAEENVPVVFFYDNVQNWCIWDSTDELLLYPEVFFCDQAGAENITDSRIREAQKLVVYISSLQDEKPSVNRIFASNRNVTGCRMQYEDTYCKVYLFE